MRHVLILALLIFASPAAARDWHGVTLDRAKIIRPGLLEEALGALTFHAAVIPQQDAIAIIDYDLPSDEPRLFLLDLKTGKVEAFLVAHGQGSDPDHDGMLDSLSDVPGSNASTAGAFLTGETYCGENGRTLRLYGLEERNANAATRAIVLHSTYLKGRLPYMSHAFIDAHGRPGRSWGCFVLPPEDLRHVIERIGAGHLLYANTKRFHSGSAAPVTPLPALAPLAPGTCPWP